jgi:hypothetical protein
VSRKIMVKRPKKFYFDLKTIFGIERGWFKPVEKFLV